MRLVTYLPGYDSKVRMEEEIEDEDYVTRPEFYTSSLKQKFINEFGSGVTKAGRSWEWSPQIKGKVNVEIKEAPRITVSIPIEEVSAGELERSVRKATEEYARGSRYIGLQQYWEAYRELREEGLSPFEARSRIRDWK